MYAYAREASVSPREPKPTSSLAGVCEMAQRVGEIALLAAEAPLFS